MQRFQMIFSLICLLISSVLAATAPFPNSTTTATPTSISSKDPPASKSLTSTAATNDFVQSHDVATLTVSLHCSAQPDQVTITKTETTTQTDHQTQVVTSQKTVTVTRTEQSVSFVTHTSTITLTVPSVRVVTAQDAITVTQKSFQFVTSTETTTDTRVTNVAAPVTVTTTIFSTVSIVDEITSFVESLQTIKLPGTTVTTIELSISTDSLTTTILQTTSEFVTEITTATTTSTLPETTITTVSDVQTLTTTLVTTTTTTPSCPCLTSAAAIPGPYSAIIGDLSGLPGQAEVVSTAQDLCSCCQACTTGNFCFAFGIVNGVCTIYEDLVGFCPQAAGYTSGTSPANLYAGGCAAGLGWYNV